MANDAATCTSERVTFEVQRSSAASPYLPGGLEVRMRCEDCGKFACTLVAAFDERAEQFVAQAWNAHHAHQLAERVEAARIKEMEASGSGLH